EVRTPPAAHVEGAGRERRKSFLDERGLAVHGARDLGAVLERAARDLVDLGLVVLAEVRGVGARDRAAVAHPRDGDRGVEPTREGDAHPFAYRQLRQNLAHVLSFVSRWCSRPPASMRNLWASAAPP